MPKAISMKETISNQDSLTLKTPLRKIMSREWEDKPDWEKILLKDTSDKGLYPKYRKNSQSLIRKWTAWF